jgi:hypothetical protein
VEGEPEHEGEELDDGEGLALLPAPPQVRGHQLTEELGQLCEEFLRQLVEQPLRPHGQLQQVECAAEEDEQVAGQVGRDVALVDYLSDGGQSEHGQLGQGRVLCVPHDQSGVLEQHVDEPGRDDGL